MGEKSEICKFYHILVLVHILIGVIEDKTRTLKKRDFRQNEWGGGGALKMQKFFNFFLNVGKFLQNFLSKMENFFQKSKIFSIIEIFSKIGIFFQKLH